MKHILATCCALLGATCMLNAQTTWTNTSGGNWDDSLNWDPNTVPNAAGADARITNFTAAGSYTITASSTQTNTVGRLDLGTTNTANTITNILAANAGLLFQTASNNAQLNLNTSGASSALSISSPITLATNLVVSLLRNGGNFIVPTFSGAIDLGGYEFRFGGSRQANINMFSTISGSGKLVFNGPGSDRQVIFNNTNSVFSGGVDLDAAGNILLLGNNATFTGSATNGLLGTGTIRFNSTVDSLSSARSPTLRADGVFFSAVDDNSNNVLPNSIVISNGRFGIIDTTDGLNSTGDISGGGKLYKVTGASTGVRPWAVNNANPSFSGTVELRDGQIFARTNDAFGTNATIVFAPQSSSNRVALAGAATNTGSPVVRLASTLVFSNTTNNLFIQTAGGSTLELAGNFSNSGAGTAGNIVFSRGDNTDTGGFAYGAGAGSGGVVASFILSGTGSLSNSIGLVTGGGAVSTLILSNTAGTQTFSGAIYGAGNVTRAGAGGTTILAATNTYTGNTVVSGGTLNLATNATLRFVIGGNGTNNGVSGTGDFVANGSFVVDLAGASTNNGDSWTLLASSLNETYGTNFIVSGFNGAGGNWTNTTNGVDYVFQQSTGLLTVGAPATNNYDSWVSYWQGVNPGFTNTSAAADPDGDTFINAEEFAFDGNPAVGSPALLTVSKSGTNAVFNWVQRKDPPGGATYQVKTTTNLASGPWTNATVTISNSANQNGLNIPADYERKEFSIPATNSGFFRVEAVVNP